ncbi:GATA zinc finger domain-containing protein 1-like [Styela clava]
MDKSKQEINDNDGSGNGNGGKRASARLKTSKQKTSERRLPTKGKSRRVIFKQKTTFKGKGTFSSITTSDCIFYKGQYYQTGDVVFVVDVDDGQKYYAQCRSFLIDPLCEKSVVLTWLLPTEQFDHSKPFDPESFYLGPEEDFPRLMDFVNFVCHAPSNYFSIYKTARSVPSNSVPV